MTLKELFQNISIIDCKGDMNTLIENLSQNATEYCKNGLLFCYKGVKFNTHNFATNAHKNGFVAFVVEEFVSSPLPQILVKNTRNIMPKVCNNFFGNVTKKLKFIGVTGTNGKTTTTNIIYQILQNAGESVALVGTNGVEFGGVHFTSKLTTPDTVELFYLFNKFANEGAKYVVMEVSAHALELNKLKGIHFEVGIFTNLTQDHLDFFGDMWHYAKAKLKFLRKTYCKFAIVNTDDKYGQMFYHILNIPKTSFGLHSPAQNFAINPNFTINSSHFVANALDNIFEITLPLPCEFNIYNALASIVCAKKLGIDNDTIFKTLENLKQVDGRMNTYKLSSGATAIIDFAHTPDGLEQVLKNIRKITSNKIITVFGCGGDRDRLKRPKMGKVASILSDITILTSDNPRSEDANKIIQNILEGISNNNYIVEVDRKKAILKAISLAKSGDIILIAGKGAESTMEIQGKFYKFSDKEVILPYTIKNELEHK